MVFPQDPRFTEFVSSFGFARSGGRRHQGNDLMAPKMTPVFAAADGVVVEVEDGGTAGRRVVIDHGRGFETWYLHLNNDTPGTDDGQADWSETVMPNVTKNRLVKAGEQIAWVGDSGNAESVGSHTHFELHYQGAAIDPYPYLKPAFDRDLRAFFRVADSLGLL
jgi:murein DD-endopeptidase MepM/ murein hydrolase activator NlpD